MSAHYFTTGSRFEWQGVLYTVDRAFPQEGKVNLENLHTGAFVTEQIEHLILEFFEGRLRFTLAQPRPKRQPKEMDLSDSPPHLAEIARHRYEIVRPLYDLSPSQRTKQVIDQHIAKVKATWPSDQTSKSLLYSLSRRTIYRWLDLLNTHGGDPRALVPRTDLRGAPGQSRLHPTTEAITVQVITQLYKVRERTTLKDIRLEIATRLDEENRLRPASDQLRLPSNYVITKRIGQLDLFEKYTIKRGLREARRAIRQYGKSPRPTLPFELVLLDSTTPDILILDDTDDLPLGKLTLTYGLDYATGYPGGFYLGFEPESYYTCLECLYHLILPKGNVTELYGTAHRWQACGVPSRLIVDNGPEFDNQHLRDSCLALGSEVTYAPVRTPEFKAGIERFFRTQNEGLLHTLPGTTFSNPRERGDYNSEAQACLYLNDLFRLLHIYVVDIYAESFHKGINGIPARRWEAAIHQGFMPRLPASAQDLRILLGRAEYRVLHHYGIEFASLRYNSPELGLLRLRLKEAVKHGPGDEANSRQVKIKYHPGDLSRLYVFNPFAREGEAPYLEAPACDPEGYTQNLSLWKHEVIRNYARRTQDRVDLAALGRAKRQIRELIQVARTRKRKTSHQGIARWNSLPASLNPQTPLVLPAPSRSEPQPVVITSSPPTEKQSTPQMISLVNNDDWELTFDLPRSCTDLLTEEGN